MRPMPRKRASSRRPATTLPSRSMLRASMPPPCRGCAADPAWGARAQCRDVIERGGGNLSALLEISRLDAGKLKPEYSTFPIEEITGQLRIEFEPVAKAKGIELTVMPSSLVVTSDRRLLRRLLQN